MSVTGPTGPSQPPQNSVEDLRPGLRAAHKIVSDKIDELCAEHRALGPSFFGWPRRRHHEIMHQVHALSQIGSSIFYAHLKQAAK